MKSIVPPEQQSYYADWHFSPAVAVGDFLVLSGITGCRADGNVSPVPEEQFKQAFESLAQVLRAAGADFGDIIDITSYHVGLRENLDAFRRTKDRYIREPYPAWTAIGVSELASEGSLIEIRVLCHKPGIESGVA